MSLLLRLLLRLFLPLQLRVGLKHSTVCPEVLQPVRLSLCVRRVFGWVIGVVRRQALPLVVRGYSGLFSDRSRSTTGGVAVDHDFGCVLAESRFRGLDEFHVLGDRGVVLDLFAHPSDYTSEANPNNPEK